MRFIPSRRILIAFVLAIVPLVPLSATAAADTLPVTAVTPADGVSVAPLTSVTGMRFQVSSPVLHITGMYVEVATQSAPLGQDGTLADDFQTDFFPLFESDAYPGTYAGISNQVPNGYWWSSRPGTYYWQAHATYLDYSTYPSQLKTYTTPIYTVTIAAPTPAPTPTQTPAPSGSGQSAHENLVPMTIAEARSFSVGLLKKKYHDHFSRRTLARSCYRVSTLKVRCRVAWRKASYKYSGSVTLWFNQSDADAEYATYTYRTSIRRRHIR